mmetsp:Transcript_23751/g.50854  ORF Transcript_23751/g.50854 Transcript_23751/m.50854 type:complete len:220 (-) Transcript_23751:1290-1949(-)
MRNDGERIGDVPGEDKGAREEGGGEVEIRGRDERDSIEGEGTVGGERGRVEETIGKRSHRVEERQKGHHAGDQNHPRAPIGVEGGAGGEGRRPNAAVRPVHQDRTGAGANHSGERVGGPIEVCAERARRGPSGDFRRPRGGGRAQEEVRRPRAVERRIAGCSSDGASSIGREDGTDQTGNIGGSGARGQSEEGSRESQGELRAEGGGGARNEIRPRGHS